MSPDRGPDISSDAAVLDHAVHCCCFWVFAGLWVTGFCVLLLHDRDGHTAYHIGLH